MLHQKTKLPTIVPNVPAVCAVGAESRYNLSRSQEFVKVQDFNSGQMRVSGCKNHYKFVWGVGVEAKSVTNNLPILSVLWSVLLFSFELSFLQIFQAF